MTMKRFGATWMTTAALTAIFAAGCGSSTTTGGDGGNGGNGGTATSTTTTGSTTNTGSTTDTGSTTNTGSTTDTGSTTNTGSTTDTGSTTTSGTTTSGTTTSTTSTTSTACTAPCCLGPTCAAVDKSCAGLVDNAGKSQFGLRISEIDITAPAALATGIVSSIIENAVPLSSPECNLAGAGTFSWLLQFDIATGKLQTGGAKPVADPALGYSFVNKVLGGIPISPVTFDAAPDVSGHFSTPVGKDVIMPIFLDATGSQFVLLPLKTLKITTGVLSASQNCIGAYNAAGLSPSNACLPDSQNPSFIKGADMSALIKLEDADKIIIVSLSETLCVLLAGNQGVVGPNGYKVCARNASNKIIYQGDACTTGVGCGDAVTFSANFAASSVDIH